MQSHPQRDPRDTTGPDVRSPEPSAHFVVLPVAREDVRVEKREVETGRVVVQVIPGSRVEKVDVELSDETASVERVPVNREVTAIEPPRQEGDVTIIPVYEEVVVVERRLMLKEEVHVRRVRQTRHEARDVELRTEEVRVTRTAADSAAGPGRPEGNPGGM
jgi:stress response protein YsnF